MYRVVLRLTGSSKYWSHGPLVRWPISPTAHWSYDPLVLHLIGPTTHWFYVSFVLLFGNIYQASNWSYISLILQLTDHATHWSFKLEPRCCRVHWFYNPIVQQPNNLTVQIRVNTLYSSFVLWPIDSMTQWSYVPTEWGQDVMSLILSISANFACSDCETMKYFISVKCWWWWWWGGGDGGVGVGGGGGGGRRSGGGGGVVL